MTFDITPPDSGAMQKWIKGHAHRSDASDEIFFETLAVTRRVLQSCEAAGYSHRSVLRWRTDDKDFAAMWDAVKQYHDEQLYDAAWQMGVAGQEVPVGGTDKNGKPNGSMIRREPAITKLLMAAADPEKYGNKVKVGVEGLKTAVIKLGSTESD